MRRVFHWLAPLLVLTSCAEMQTGGVGETNVALYRGLKVHPNGSIDWTKASFGVSGKPVPTLSFFNGMAGEMPCWLEVTVQAPDDVKPHVVASLTIPTPPPGNANPGPWSTTFDDNPAGHWSIAKDTIGGENNTQSSQMAAAVFTAMAKDGTAKVVNGSRDDCKKPD